MDGNGARLLAQARENNVSRQGFSCVYGQERLHLRDVMQTGSARLRCKAKQCDENSIR